MPEDNGRPTEGRTDNEQRTIRPISRRRCLQLAGVGAVGGAFGVGRSLASGSGEVPHTIVFDGTVSRGRSSYEFEVTGSVEPHEEIGSIENNDTIDGGSVSGTVHRDIDAYRFGGDLVYLDVKGNADVSISYGDGGDVAADRLEIVAGSGGDVDYRFTATDRIELVTDNGDWSANEDEETVVENEDGSWTVTGSTADGAGDTFDFWGDVTEFDPLDGDFTLFRNGEELTAYELTGEEPPEEDDREHSYSFEATGDEWADYYLEVEAGGDIIASTLDGAVIESDFHWVSEDGTKAAGRVHPETRHAYEFDTLLLDVSIDGEADAFVNGRSSNLDWYPQDGATGDGWKGGFPWQEQEEEREHSYSFEATGDEWADYYLEVEDGGDIIASTLDGAVIDPEFHWISEDGTKAAGRVHPGERNAYEFDTLLLDVTIDGEADAFVNGSSSNLDWYPQDGATGDGWKGGFPWQDEDAPDTIEGGPIGGGLGYDHTVSRDAADVVVSSRSELGNALSSASSGDVVYVEPGASIDLGSGTYTVPSGVTLASNRGINDAPGGHLYTDYTPDYHTSSLELSDGARLTGVRLQGPYYEWFSPSFYAEGAGVTAYGNSEVDNCELWGFAYGSVACRGTPHVHHNNIHHNPRDGLGYGVSCIGGHPVVEWNYMNYNRHGINSDGEGGYTVRYNHFGPDTLSHVIDAHRPGGTRMEIYNNTVEAVDGADGDQRPAVAIRGEPDDVADIRDNWFYNPDEPLDSPDGWTTRAAIIQVYTDDWVNMEWSGNHYGSSEPSTDIGHPR